MTSSAVGTVRNAPPPTSARAASVSTPSAAPGTAANVRHPRPPAVRSNTKINTRLLNLLMCVIRPRVPREPGRVRGDRGPRRRPALHLPLRLQRGQIRGLRSPEEVTWCLYQTWVHRRLNKLSPSSSNTAYMSASCSVVSLLQLMIPCFSGLTNLYTSQVYWCSTRVDINGFHVRGPYNNMGVSRY